MNTDNSTSQKQILRWAIAVAVILFVLGSAALIGIVAWKRNNAATEANVTIAPKANATANWSPATFSVHAADGLLRTSEKSWSIKGGRAFMQVRRKEDDSFELRFVYPFKDFLPPETIALVHTRWGLSQVEKLADELNITPEQLAALKAVSPATDIPVATPDRERLRELFEDYLSTESKAAAENALIEAVAAIDATYYERTRERIAGIAEKVKNIFNEDQLTALSGRFAPRSN